MYFFIRENLLASISSRMNVYCEYDNEVSLSVNVSDFDFGMGDGPFISFER